MTSTRPTRRSTADASSSSWLRRRPPRGAAEKPSTALRRPSGPSPGSATALLAYACTMRSLCCSSLHPDLGHLDRRISRRRFSAAPLSDLTGGPHEHLVRRHQPLLACTYKMHPDARSSGAAQLPARLV